MPEAAGEAGRGDARWRRRRCRARRRTCRARRSHACAGRPPLAPRSPPRAVLPKLARPSSVMASKPIMTICAPARRMRSRKRWSSSGRPGDDRTTSARTWANQGGRQPGGHHGLQQLRRAGLFDDEIVVVEKYPLRPHGGDLLDHVLRVAVADRAREHGRDRTELAVERAPPLGHDWFGGHLLVPGQQAEVRSPAKPRSRLGSSSDAPGCGAAPRLAPERERPRTAPRSPPPERHSRSSSMVAWPSPRTTKGAWSRPSSVQKLA